MGGIEYINTTLKSWCCTHGAYIGPVESCNFTDSYRGIKALEDIPSGTLILSIPKQLLMGHESALREPVLRCAVEQQLSERQLLGIHLLHECSKGTDSFWYPYILSLPRSYSTAVCFTDAEVMELQVHYAITCLFRAKEEAMAAHRGCIEVLKQLHMDPKWKCRHAWRWAWATMSSRTMFLPHREKGRRAPHDTSSAGVLTPFGDLHNYAPPPDPFTLHLQGYDDAAMDGRIAGVCGDGAFNEDADAYEIYARCAYSKGEEVFLCYGRHTNLELVEHYGFVLENNKHDYAVMHADSFPAHVKAQGVLEQLDPESIHVTWDGNPSFELMRALRLGCLSSSERKQHAYKVLNDQSVDTATENEALKALSVACKTTLNAMATTLEQDFVFLSNSGLSDCMKIALAWRISYKQKLLACISLCESLLL